MSQPNEPSRFDDVLIEIGKRIKAAKAARRPVTDKMKQADCWQSDRDRLIKMMEGESDAG